MMDTTLHFSEVAIIAFYSMLAVKLICQDEKNLKMNMNAHLSSIMTQEMADTFQSEIIKSLNQITFNGQRKIISVLKYGNSIAVHIEPDKHFPKNKEVYSFGLASKLSEAVLDVQ